MPDVIPPWRDYLWANGNSPMGIARWSNMLVADQHITPQNLAEGKVCCACGQNAPSCFKKEILDFKYL
jgi:hypothetical protein